LQDKFVYAVGFFTIVALISDCQPGHLHRIRGGDGPTLKNATLPVPCECVCLSPRVFAPPGRRTQSHHTGASSEGFFLERPNDLTDDLANYEVSGAYGDCLPRLDLLSERLDDLTFETRILIGTPY
jgi:hypothetical protein